MCLKDIYQTGGKPTSNRLGETQGCHDENDLEDIQRVGGQGVTVSSFVSTLKLFIGVEDGRFEDGIVKF